MTHEEVLRLAQAATAYEGWPWREPVHVERLRRWLFFGPIEWHVMTNANYRGGNVNIWIDDRSGKVAKKGFAPR
jgi:hypothetical protein